MFRNDNTRIGFSIGLTLGLVLLLAAVACGESTPPPTATPLPPIAAAAAPTATPPQPVAAIVTPSATPTSTATPLPPVAPTATPTLEPSPTKVVAPALPTPDAAPTSTPLAAQTAPTPTPSATPVPTSTPTPTPAPTPTPGPPGCAEDPGPNWWIPGPQSVPIPSYIAYLSPSLESLILESDFVVRASLASVSTRTVSLEQDFFWIDDSAMLPGQIHAPLCAATLELHFEIVEYLKGTGPTDVTVEVPMRHSYLDEDRLLRYLHLEEEALLNAAEWWSRRSSVWDDGLAVLFLKRDEYDEVDLTFTERSWGYDHYYLGGPQEYERSWLPSVGEDFVPPPATFGNLGWLGQEHGDEAPLTGDGSAPRYVSESGPSREGPTPVVGSVRLGNIPL